MFRFFIVLLALFSCIFIFSFFIQNPKTSAQSVKENYLNQTLIFEKEIIKFEASIKEGDAQKIQKQFLVLRTAYKAIETIVEYYFAAFASKLNGAPIPFYEENEPDKGQQIPVGMQVIEGLIFPKYKLANKNELQNQTANLLSNLKYMQATNEAFAFQDDYIFDAITEELYRITALGITGFDSQAAVNGLPESNAALQGVKNILQLYKDDIASTKNYNELDTLITAAQNYLNKPYSFNAFDRMEFITNHLNPITKWIGVYKKQKGYAANKFPSFYSCIKKDNTLFSKDNFEVNKFLDDNTTSPEKIELGRKLFFDVRLSKDNKRSCATCHNPAKAFTDGFTTSVALDGHSSLPRNAPTLWNVGLQRNLFYDSRSSSLEDQVMQVLNSKNEMNGSAEKVANEIKTKKEYAAIYAKVYPADVNKTTAQNISNAIACYERTLVALNSKFDKHMRGENNLNVSEINGFNLFMGKAKCGTCHFMPLFNGAKPPRYYYMESEVIGVPNDNKKQTKLDEDAGRYAITNLPMHKYAFKTTTLRNIALTAPYMHNGVFKTLEEVVSFYNNGGGKGLKIAPSNQSLPFDKLNLSVNEQKNIVAFLKTLTDTLHTTY